MLEREVPQILSIGINADIQSGRRAMSVARLSIGIVRAPLNRMHGGNTVAIDSGQKQNVLQATERPALIA